MKLQKKCEMAKGSIIVLLAGLMGVLHVMAADEVLASDALGITDGDFVNRDTEGVELSGITWAGGDTYYAVNDANVSNRLYKITFSLNSSGQISSYHCISSVKLESSSNLEGCAHDPASGNVWVSMEGNNSSIREYDPETGAWLRTAPLPDIFKNNMRGNFRLEALTISGDGLTMWTANEEALICDGSISTTPRETGGTTVRLQKFTRASVRDNWTAAAQYAYKTYGLNTPYGYNNAQRSGVAGLCALPNGQLLVLEREFSGVEEDSNLSSIWAGLDSSYTMAIVLADYSSATDVSAIPSLSEATYTPVSKAKLFEKNTGYADYEGICLGPSISDDSVSLLLISDGGGNSMVEKKLMSKILTGMDVRTLYVEDAANSESTGGPYRYVGGSTATVSYPGAGDPYEADLRVQPSWTATANNAQGDGSYASFTISADDTVRWSTTTNTGLSLLATDSFERYAPGTGPAAMEGWSGNGIVRAEECPRPTPAGYPLERETHTQVFVADGDATRGYPALAGNQGALLDLMARVTPENSEVRVEDTDVQIALGFGADGRPMLRHGTADGSESTRTALSSRAFADGDWVRVSFLFDYADAPDAAWCQMRLDGEPCVTDAGVRSPADPRSPGSWYRTLGGAAAAGRVSRLGLTDCAVDDVALYDATGAFEFKDAGATTNGVPCTWLAERGLPWDTTVDLDGDAYDSRDEFAAGTDPLDEGNYFRIVGTDFDDLGRFRIRFLGSAPLANYLVYAGADLSVPEADWSLASGETVRAGQGTNLWTQAKAPVEGEDAGFFRVRAALPQ